MFNTTYIRQPDVHVNVEQKPHDSADAARLYGECRAKAEAEVADATIIKFGARNELTGVVVRSDKTYHDMQTHVRLLFSINGERFDIHVQDSLEHFTIAAYQEIGAKMLGKFVAGMVPKYRSQSITETKSGLKNSGGSEQ